MTNSCAGTATVRWFSEMFQCDKCGACCRRLGDVPLFADLDRGDGVCRYLQGNLCGIYEKRPLLCRVDDSYKAFFADLMSREEYYKYNYEACERLKQEDTREE